MTEGNTSGGAAVIPNGGEVCRKKYSLGSSAIDGFGRPDWKLVDTPEYELGWHNDSNGWWFADTKTTYYRACWQVINGHKYHFNPDGYAMTNWHEIEGKWYYFEPRAGHPLECALYVSNADGAQEIGMF